MKKNWTILKKLLETENPMYRTLLYGPPGTGKTTYACKTVGSDGHYNITLHEETSVAELIGHWVPRGQEFVWHNGPASLSWIQGKPLVLNEIDRSSGCVLSILLGLLDDPSIAHLSLPNGETISPKEGFCVIATMNGRLSDLPEALADRFDVKLNISMPNPQAIKSLPEDLRHLVENSYKAVTGSKSPSISFREVASYSRVREILGETDALNVVFQERAPEIRTVLKIGLRDGK